MTSSYGDKPFGLHQVNLIGISGTPCVTLNAAQTLSFGERIVSAELPGNDQVCALVSFVDAVEWELEAGGIPLDAYALITGRTATESGSTPNRTNTIAARGAANMPYFRIRGKALGEGADDIHVLLRRCKITDTIEGQFAQGEFWVTKCKGIALDDGVGLWEFVQNETAAALATT